MIERAKTLLAFLVVGGIAAGALGAALLTPEGRVLGGGVTAIIGGLFLVGWSIDRVMTFFEQRRRARHYQWR